MSAQQPSAGNVAENAARTMVLRDVETKPLRTVCVPKIQVAVMLAGIRTAQTWPVINARDVAVMVCAVLERTRVAVLRIVQESVVAMVSVMQRRRVGHALVIAVPVAVPVAWPMRHRDVRIQP